MKKLLFLCCLIISSCIDRISIEIPNSYTSQLIVDGVITDERGPYTVKLSRATRIEKFLLLENNFVTDAKITISDNSGNAELLAETEPGTYQTKANGIQGVVGREYSIKIQTKEGKEFESLPDKMNPAGELDSLYYEFESYTPLADQTRYGYRFYIDAQGPTDTENLLRWRFAGVFEISAEPKLHTKYTEGDPCYPDPPRCSGWVLGEFGLKLVGQCSCCSCWVTEPEDKPHVSDQKFIADGKFKHVEVGFVPIEYFPFQKKHRIEVKQMSLSRVAYDYWKIIQSQKEGTATLFQPPTGKIRTNIVSKTGAEEVQGIFYASAIKTKQIHITNDSIDLRVPRWNCEVGIIADDCRKAYLFSSTQPPTDWK
jgi:Domain of unknown function (DUF4249)